MGSDRLYVTVEPSPGADPESLLAALPTGDFFEWEKVEAGLVKCCRQSHDRAIARRMLESVVAQVRRARMVEVIDGTEVGSGYLYVRADGQLLLVDRTQGGELRRSGLINYFDWRHGFDAPW